MPFNVTPGSSLEFVAALYDGAGNISVPPIGIYLQVFYVDASGAQQQSTAFLQGLDDYFIGQWTVPNMHGTAVIRLALTSTGAYAVSPPDPYLRAPGNGLGIVS